MRLVRATAAAMALVLSSGLLATAPAVEASEGPQIWIEGPTAGAAVRGTIPVTASTSDGVSTVTFYRSKAGEPWTAFGTDVTAEDGWSGSWETTEFSGEARVKAIATSGEMTGQSVIELFVDNSKPAVRLSRSHQVFSPGNDGRNDAAVVKVLSSERGRIVLKLLGLSGRVRKSWKVNDAKELRVNWDGRTRDGFVWDGAYRFRASVTDRVGHVGRIEKKVVVDRAGPHVRFTSAGSRKVDGLHRIPFEFTARGGHGPLKVRLDVWDQTGWVDRTAWRRRNSGSHRIEWRPGYQRIDRPLTPGLYRTRVTVRDAAGNETRSGVRKLRVLRPVRASVYSRIPSAGSRVALTFDDCNFDDAWASILKTLEAFDVKATFFCPGQVVNAHPELARRTVRAGHSVGSHGWDHAALGGRASSETAWRLARDEATWWSVARGEAAPFFRPPFGSMSDSVVTGAGLSSYQRVVLWDVDSNDWRGGTPAQIAGRVVHGAREGSIVLLHVIDRTAAALPAMLRGLEAKRLKPVSLHALFRAGGLR